MLLISCTFEEKFIKENNNSKNYQLFEKKFSDIITEKEFKNSFSKVAKPNFKGSSKTIMEQQYGFEIDETAIVKEIHKDRIITYTLGIKTDSLHSNQLRNLLVEQAENNEVSAYILSYNLTAPLLPTGHNSFSLNYSTATIEPINYNANQTSRVLLSNGCYLSNVLMCSEPWVGQTFGSIHVAGHDCFNPAYLSMQSVIDCPNEGGGGGETPIDNGGSGGGGGSPTSPTGPGLPTFEDESFDPCILIKKLQLDLGFKNRMKNLVSAARNYGFEEAQTLNNNPNATPSNNYNYQIYQGTPYKPEAKYNVYTNTQGVIHSHYADLLSIFSAGDLQGLYHIMKNDLITNNVFFCVVTSNGAYLLQVKDKQTFLNFGNKNLSNDTDLLQLMKDMAYNFNIKNENSSLVNEEGFIKMLTKLNCGLSISSVNYLITTPASTSMFDIWTKKSYNNKTKEIDPSNCN